MIALQNRSRPGISFYREEIARRESAERQEDMLDMTQTMKNLTWAVLFLTLVNVAIFAYQVFSAAR